MFINSGNKNRLKGLKMALEGKKENVNKKTSKINSERFQRGHKK